MTVTREPALAPRWPGAIAAAWAVGLRAVGVLVLAVAAGGAQQAHARLTRWDADWYARIAANGYGFTRLHPDGRRLSDEAFFPLYPWLERGVHAAIGLSIENAGLLVSALSIAAAAWGICVVAARVAGARAGIVLTVLWSALPTAIVLSMAYSEALFVALAAWSLYAVLRGRLVPAAGLAVLAGLTRPIGLAVVAAVLVAALAELRRGRRADTPVLQVAMVRQVALVRAIAAIVIAPLGWLGYVAWVGWRRGDPLGYFAVQAGWGNGFDGGRAFATWIADHVSDVSHPAQVAAGVGLIAGLAAVLWLFVLGVRDRQPLPLLVYTGVLLVFALTTSRYFGSKPRYLLPAFPLLLPVAVRVAGRITSLRRRGAATVAGIAGLAGTAVLVAAFAVGGALTILGSGPP